MDIKILIATHKKYKMPSQECYIPIHVGREGKDDIGYIGDNVDDNISTKNPYFCELTGLYWGWKNIDCEYLGLVHYRRHFSSKPIISRTFKDKHDCILTEEEAREVLKNNDAILAKKRKYYIETLYSHYGHTHYFEHLDMTREIIENKYPEYLEAFDKVMKKRSGHMFNMFIMKKELVNDYCTWLFDILDELEKKIDITEYDAYQARLFGRVSELLLNVWVEKNNVKYEEISHMHMEKINWVDKIYSFMRAKFTQKKFGKSF